MSPHIRAAGTPLARDKTAVECRMTPSAVRPPPLLWAPCCTWCNPGPGVMQPAAATPTAGRVSLPVGQPVLPTPPCGLLTPSVPTLLLHCIHHQSLYTLPLWRIGCVQALEHVNTQVSVHSIEPAAGCAGGGTVPIPLSFLLRRRCPSTQSRARLPVTMPPPPSWPGVGAAPSAGPGAQRPPATPQQ